MIDEATLRRVIREEVAKVLPRRDVKQLTVPECARFYRTSVRVIRGLIRDGSLEAIWRDGGKCGIGKGHYMIPTMVAARHPKLGGGVE